MGITDFQKNYFCAPVIINKIKELPRSIYIDFNLYWLSRQSVQNISNQTSESYHETSCEFLMNVLQKSGANIGGSFEKIENRVPVYIVVDSMKKRQLLKIETCFGRMRSVKAFNPFALDFDLIKTLLINSVQLANIDKVFDIQFIEAETDADEYVFKNVKKFLHIERSGAHSVDTILADCNCAQSETQEVDIGSILVYTNDSDFLAHYPVKSHVSLIHVDFNNSLILKNFEFDLNNPLIKIFCNQNNIIAKLAPTLDTRMLTEMFFKIIASVSANDYSTANFLDAETFKYAIVDKNIINFPNENHNYNVYDTDFYFTYWTYYLTFIFKIDNRDVRQMRNIKALINNSIRHLNILSIPESLDYSKMVVGSFNFSPSIAFKRKHGILLSEPSPKKRLGVITDNKINTESDVIAESLVSGRDDIIIIDSIKDLRSTLHKMMVNYIGNHEAAEYLKKNYKNFALNDIKTIWAGTAIDLYCEKIKSRCSIREFDYIVAGSIFFYILLCFRVWFINDVKLEDNESFNHFVITLEKAFSIESNPKWTAFQKAILKFYYKQ